MAPERIVVGVGRSSGGRHALAWAAALARSRGAELVVLGAFTPLEPDAGSDGAGQQRLWSELADAARPVATSGVTCRVEVEIGDPRRILQRSARTYDADVVVIGRGGPRGEPGFLHFSSVSEYLAHHASVPLVIVPEDAPTSIGRIALGVDGSTDGRRAAAWCAGVAASVGAAVTAIVVHEPYLEWTPEPDPAGWRADTEDRILHELAPEIVAAGVDVTPVAVRGRPPADGLLHASAGADLLVVGTRGAGGFVGLRAGGTTMSLVHRAGCALALVPPPPGPDDF